MNGATTNERELFAQMDRFAAGVKEKAVYVSSQAAAEVFYREAKLNCPVSDHAHWFYGTQYRVNGIKYFFNAGTLRDSIYQVMSKDNSGEGKATYHVAWNHKKCPYGFMVEYGTANAPAHPFMRRSFDGAKSDASLAAKAAITEFLAGKK